ncbi:MAG TPA: cytochrome c [Myxococcota bacterium]|jgi:mono/diheme cytochrome c family protein
MRQTALCVALLLAAPLAARGDQEKSPLSERLNAGHAGYAEYQQYCAACHGVFADGQGLVAPVLKQAPPNLRQLGIRYGTPLPRQKLIRSIDGSDPVLSHGSREMPIWGTRLYGEAPVPTPDSRQRGSILTILDYLESIQEAGTPLLPGGSSQGSGGKAR